MRNLFVSLLLLLACSQTQAHLLKVFAFTQPADELTQLINGKVYFSGGQSVSNTPVAIFDSAGQNVKNIKTNAQGKFQVILAKENFKLVADTQDGHKAIWHIKAQQLNSPDNTENAPLDSSPPNLRQIENIIAIQINTQLTPLTEQIIKLQEKRYLQDVIGAIGYIAGLSGIFLWFRQRKDNKDIKS